MATATQAPAVAERIAGKPTRPGTFKVQSATDPEQSWAVEWQSPKTHWCGCPAFAKSGTCRHSKAVFEAIRAEFEAARAGGPRWPTKENAS